MKKIFLIIILSLFWFSTIFADSWNPNSPDFVWPPAPKQEEDNKGYNNSWCKYNDWDSVSKLLDWCKPKKVVSSTDMKLETWFKKKVNWFITNLMVVLWIVAVWAIVYAWWLMQFSAWEDEQINKAKNIIKWTIIWFLLLISASWIVYIVINVMFWLWWG